MQVKNVLTSSCLSLFQLVELPPISDRSDGHIKMPWSDSAQPPFVVSLGASPLNSAVPVQHSTLKPKLILSRTLKFHEEFSHWIQKKMMTKFCLCTHEIVVMTNNWTISGVHATPDGPCSSSSKSPPASRLNGTGGRYTVAVSPVGLSPRPGNHRNPAAVTQGSCYGPQKAHIKDSHSNSAYFFEDKALETKLPCM